MQLFDSVKMYLFSFCVLALIAVGRLRQLTHSPDTASTAGFDIENIVLALISIHLAVYLACLLRKLSSRIEQTAVVLVELDCMLWLTNWLANLGMVWLTIPHALLLTTTVHCAITVLAGVRVSQVVWHRKRDQAAQQGL